MFHPFFMYFVNSFPFPHKLLVHYFLINFSSHPSKSTESNLVYILPVILSFYNILWPPPWFLCIFCQLFYHFTRLSDPRLGFWVYFASILSFYNILWPAPWFLSIFFHLFYSLTIFSDPRLAFEYILPFSLSFYYILWPTPWFLSIFCQLFYTFTIFSDIFAGGQVNSNFSMPEEYNNGHSVDTIRMVGLRRVPKTEPLGLTVKEDESGWVEGGEGLKIKRLQQFHTFTKIMHPRHPGMHIAIDSLLLILSFELKNFLCADMFPCTYKDSEICLSVRPYP